MKIAVWSGPRNLSTAMMYAFGARSDFTAWDEPFYAAWLKATGADHPLREVVMQVHETDPLKIASLCEAPEMDGRPHIYMKHMPHHMADGFPLDWARSCVNIHLIRHPARVIASYVRKNEIPSPEDISYQRQLDIFRRFPGPIVDSFDIREDPAAMLGKLCAEIGLSFQPDMLAWPAGPKHFDGVWASHWYDAVHRSTGFSDPEGPLPELDGAAAGLADEMMPIYRHLAKQRLR